MIRYSILIALMSTCTAYATPLHLRWTAETSDPKPYRAEIFRGETLELRSQLRQYGVDVVLPDTATASLYYQTNGMAGAWWQSPATATTSGVVSATWTPALDAGASQYVFFIGVIDTYLSYTDGEVPHGPYNINSINRTQLTEDGRVVLQLLDFDQGDTGTLSVGNKNYDFVMRDNSDRRINYLSFDDVSDFIDPLPDGTIIPGRVVRNQYGDLLQYRLTWNKASREFEESAVPWPIGSYKSS